VAAKSILAIALFSGRTILKIKEWVRPLADACHFPTAPTPGTLNYTIRLGSALTFAGQVFAFVLRGRFM